MPENSRCDSETCLAIVSATSFCAGPPAPQSPMARRLTCLSAATRQWTLQSKTVRARKKLRLRMRSILPGEKAFRSPRARGYDFAHETRVIVAAAGLHRRRTGDDARHAARANPWLENDAV